MKKTKNNDFVVATKVNKALADELDQIAADDHRTRADVLRLIIMEHVEITRRLKEKYARGNS